MSKETKKITELSEYQKSMLPVYQKKWIDIGLSTEPCNFLAAIDAAKLTYRISKQEEPTVFFLTNCPTSAARLAARLFSTPEPDLSKKQIQEWLDDNVFNADGSFSLDRDSTILVRGDTQEDVAKEAIRYGRSKFKNDNEIPKKLVHKQLKNQIYGFQEYEMGFYDFFQEVCGIDLHTINGLVAMAKCCGWWAPHTGGCVFQHRPLEIHRDELGQLHNPDGPAVMYRGGITRVCAIHGKLTSADAVHAKYADRPVVR